MSKDLPATTLLSALFARFTAAHKALTTLPEDDTTRLLSTYLLGRCKTMMDMPFPNEGKLTTLSAWAAAVGAEATITQAEYMRGQVMPHHYTLRMREIGTMNIALGQAQIALNIATLRA